MMQRMTIAPMIKTYMRYEVEDGDDHGVDDEGHLAAHLAGQGVDGLEGDGLEEK